MWLIAALAQANPATQTPDLTAFLEMRIEGAGPGASQKEEDRALTTSLERLVKTLAAIEMQRVARIESGVTAEQRLVIRDELARAYAHMAEAFRRSPPPRYLSADQIDVYKMALDDRASTFDERERTHLEALLTDGSNGGLRCLPEQLSAVERLASDASNPWAAIRSLPALGGGGCTANDPALAMLVSGDPRGALAVMPRGASLPQAVALEIVGDSKGARAIWTQLVLEANRHSDFATLVAATASYLRQRETKKAKAFAQSARDAFIPGHPAAAEFLELEQRLERAEHREQEASTQKERDTAQLNALRNAIPVLQSALARCSDIALREEAQMALEQAVLILESGDTQIAGDALLLIESYRERVAMCAP